MTTFELVIQARTPSGLALGAECRGSAEATALELEYAAVCRSVVESVQAQLEAQARAASGEIKPA